MKDPREYSAAEEDALMRAEIESYAYGIRREPTPEGFEDRWNARPHKSPAKMTPRALGKTQAIKKRRKANKAARTARRRK